MARRLLLLARMSLRIAAHAVAMSAVLAAASDMPLRISDVATSVPAHVTLTNTSRQPVTAWVIAATTRSSSGTHRELYSADGYLSEVTHGLPGSNARIERIMPGESRELPLDAMRPGSTVDVIAAVLDDGTAVGDEDALKTIFAKRASERDALKAVVDTFGEVLPAKHGAEALTALRERFAALVQRQDDVPCRAALDAV